MVLNACEGARACRTDPFAGTAQALVRQGVPAVIAMQFEIADETAILLASEYYASVAAGRPIDASLADARRIIYAERNGIEWVTPFLYLRAPDGRIFNVAKTPVVQEYIAAEEAKRADRGAVAPVVQERIASEEAKRADRDPVDEKAAVHRPDNRQVPEGTRPRGAAGPTRSVPADGPGQTGLEAHPSSEWIGEKWVRLSSWAAFRIATFVLLVFVTLVAVVGGLLGAFGGVKSNAHFDPEQLASPQNRTPQGRPWERLEVCSALLKESRDSWRAKYLGGEPKSSYRVVVHMMPTGGFETDGIDLVNIKLVRFQNAFPNLDFDQFRYEYRQDVTERTIVERSIHVATGFPSDQLQKARETCSIARSCVTPDAHVVDQRGADWGCD